MNAIVKLRRLFIISWIWMGGLLFILLSLQTSPIVNGAIRDDLCFNSSPGTIPNPERILELKEGLSSTFSVKLCSEPESHVNFVPIFRNSANMTDTDHFRTEPLTLKFETNNWDELQPIVVTAVNNQEISPTQTYSLYFQAVSSDDNFQWEPPAGRWVRLIIIDDDSTPSYLPIVARAPTSTPTPTPTPPATWQSFANTTELNLDVVRIHNASVFLGERSESTQKGIYEQSANCSTVENFTQVNSQFPMRDLFFRDSRGLAASFGGKAFYASSLTTPSSWKATNSSMNQYVYGVVEATNGKSYAGTDIGLYSSEDKGSTWTLITPASGSNPKLVNSFTYRDSDGDFLWVATFGNGVSRYQLSNNSFVAYNNGLSTARTKEVLDLVLRKATQEVYIGTNSGVYKGVSSTNDAWTNFGLADQQVVSLEFVGNTLYAGTNTKGIYTRNLDSGADWVPQPSPLDGQVIRDLHYDETDLCKNSTANRNGLLVATDKGLWVYR